MAEARGAWEPWQPMVGERVRIRLNGECQRLYAPSTSGARHGFRGHVLETDGAIGTVTAIGDYGDGHRYGVAFDAPLRFRYNGWWPAKVRGERIAALELEPLGA